MDNATVVFLVSAIVAPIVTLLTIMWNSRQARLREERLRQWEIEDRTTLAAKAEEHFHLIREDLHDNTKKTDLGVEAAHRAYKEANSVNEKISDLNARLLAKEDKL